MRDRKEFELNDDQFKRIMDASKPVPYMVIGGVTPTSPRENAERVWARLGDEMGFVWRTVKPVPSKGDRFFTAKATEDSPDA